MGSGFSACTGPSSVGVTESQRAGRQHAPHNNNNNNNNGGVHSDSCDSGISISEGHRKSKSRHVVTSRDVDSEEEEGVEGNDVACGTDFIMTSTPNSTSHTFLRPSSPQSFTTPDIKEAKVLDTRKNRFQAGSGSKPLRHNPHSSSSLMELAIHEEDEETHEGEPEDKRLRAQRPPRPKSAHFRKSRAQSHRGRVVRGRKQSSGAGSVSGGESSADVTSDEGEDDFDCDILTIPDETQLQGSRSGTLTTVKLGPQFQAQTKISDPHAGDTSHVSEDMDWWTEDDGSSARTTEDDGSSARTTEAGPDSARSLASSLTLKFSGRVWSEGRVAKKCLQEIEQDLRAATLTMCAKEEVTKQDYYHVVTSLRPRFLRLLGDFKMASGEILGRLPIECQHIVQLEDHLAQKLMELSAEAVRGPVDLGPLVTRHLQELEELCDREGALPVRPLTLHSGQLRYKQQREQEQRCRQQRQALYDESGVEDESDSMEEDLQGSGGTEFAQPLPPSVSSRHDSHVTKEAAVLSSLPPRGACKSARPPSLASSMNSSRARSGARRPVTDTSALGGVKGHNMQENEGSLASMSTTTTSTSATPVAKKGGGKSRPDSGIVVSSCSASYSSSEATRETDTDLATQTEWISTSLDMLEQILQVRTENQETMKSLVDAITHGSTSEQLKAHALYRWLASQSMTYYAKCKCKANSPTGKLKQLAEGKICYATLYQEMARAAGLKCEKIEGYAKGPDYRPGTPIGTSSNSQYKHSWNAILLDGHYHFLDAGFGALPCKFFVEHFFMTPPDEMRLSHFPRDKRWLLMTQSLSMQDFEGTLKTWPTMFAFNIRPLNMKSVLRSYDGRLSITVLLRNVAVTPQLEYIGPGTPQDADALVFNIDQEIRNMDNAETFHLNLPEEGTYFFTLMVHDLEEDEDIPAFQYRVEYTDELL